MWRRGRHVSNVFIFLQSKMIPILEPEYVAERAVASILTNKEVCLLPAWTFLLIAIKVNLEQQGGVIFSRVWIFKIGPIAVDQIYFQNLISKNLEKITETLKILIFVKFPITFILLQDQFCSIFSARLSLMYIFYLKQFSSLIKAGLFFPVKSHNKLLQFKICVFNCICHRFKI